MRRYQEAERDAAIALALRLGDEAAAHQLGIPRRTVSSWHHRPAQAEIIVKSRAQLVDRYREAEELALERVITGLRDRRTPVHHAARALEALATQRALLAGQATARTETIGDPMAALRSLSDADARDLRVWLDHLAAATDDELAAELPRIVSDIRRVESAALLTDGREPDNE